MSEPLPHLDHRVSLFTKSDLLFLIVLLLLAVMALHYQGAVWQHAQQVGANDSTNLVLVLDWPIWSQPAIDGIIWLGLASVLGLTLLCVLRRRGFLIKIY